MIYFKHFSNANSSDHLENIINDLGFEGYGRYWRLLEYLCSLYDGESTKFKIHKRTLRDVLRFRSSLKLDSYLVTIGLQRGYKVVTNGNHYEIEAVILSELQSRDFKKARSERAPAVPKIKIKNKIKNKKESVLFGENVFEEFYTRYPKKIGKQKGKSIFLKAIKNQDDLNNLNRCLETYLESVKRATFEQSYRGFAVFMGSWEDWKEYEHAKTDEEKHHAKLDNFFYSDEQAEALRNG